MLTDRQGKDITVGSIVSWRLVITNEITGADPQNLLAKPEHPWPGIPEDQRFSLAAAYVDVVKPAPSAKGESPAAAPPAAPVAYPAAAAPQPQPQPPAVAPPVGWPQHYPGYR